MELSADQLRMIVVNMIILILSITVHEFGHAFVADKLGDRLPRSEGRVTLNPISHADPIGTLALPALSLLLGGYIGFGWGRPVRVNPLAFTRRLRMKTAHMLVAAAGPSMNILFGLFLSVLLLILYKTGVVLPGHAGVFEAISYAVLLNFVLAFFNLVPAPPLDGGAVLAGILPDRMQPAYQRFSQYGIFVLFAFIAIPQLGRLVTAPARFLYHVWAGSVLGLPTLL